MTEKEKAKAYDEAIERAKKWNNTQNIDKITIYGIRIIEEIFPELKEDEADMIKKDLIQWVDEFPDIIWRGHYKKDIIDWLEKQCESNPYNGVSFKYNGHTWRMCGRDNGVEILVDGEIKERIFLDNKPQGKSAFEAIKEEKVDNANKK